MASPPADRLQRLVRAPDLAPQTIADHLDSLAPEARQAEVATLTKRDQARLFEATAGFRTRTLTDLVPEPTAPMVGITHRGKNSLPLFSRFAKVFCRPDDATLGELWGYNANPAIVERCVGPGYFVAYAIEDSGRPEAAVLIDYCRLPPRHPTTWPRMIPNEAKLGRFVYQGMQDVLRGISTHVSVGRARKNGRETDNWFVLCRT